MERGILQEPESACDVNARAGAGAKGPLRTHRSLAPSHLNSQWAESTACYAGAFNLACHACTNTWLPLRLRYAGGSAPKGWEGGSH